MYVGYNLMHMPSDEQRIPIFPLSGVVLFPYTRQLLHIFEPRYRQLTEDALSGDGTFGMILPRSSEQDPDAPAPLHRIGCLGRIEASRRLPDGRFVLLLEGRSRFEVVRELPTTKLYREVVGRLLPEVEFQDLEPSAQAPLIQAREQLESKLLEIAESLPADATEAVSERLHDLDPIALTHSLAFGLDCEAIDKQSLLEAPDPLARCQQLIELLEFHRAAARLPDTPRTLN